MRRTNIHLTDELRARLLTEARYTGERPAAIVRRVLDAYFSRINHGAGTDRHGITMDRPRRQRGDAARRFSGS